MITLLRRLRHSLIQSNRTRKYLLYAIGEIGLVVIGILIALQINNWNEDRIVENTIRQALLKLKEDVNNDITYLRNLDSLYSEWQKQASKMQTDLSEGKTKRFNTFEDFIIGRGSMNALSIKTTTIEEMTNTGILYKINDPFISQSINEYYEFAKKELAKLNSDNQEFYRYVLNTSGYQYINLIGRIYNKKNLDYIDWSWLQDPRSEKYMIFEGRIAFHKQAITVNKELIGQLEIKAKAVLAAIE